MADWLDSNLSRSVGYIFAGVACIHVGLTERRRYNDFERRAVIWPTFWFMTAGLLFAMAIGRLLEIDDLITGFGRSRARLAGWYRTRRGFQAMLVGTVSISWMVTVFLAIWRVPERRRRCLPTTLVVFTMICFAAIRLVSLHQVDALLYNRSVATVRVVALVEWCLVVAAVVTTYWHPSGPMRAGTSGQPRG